MRRRPREPEGSRLVQFELFKRVLGIELKRSQRYGFPLSILLASLDREVANGDRDLLASAARSAIRDIDIPGRVRRDRTCSS